MSTKTTKPRPGTRIPLADNREVERSMLTALQNVEAEIARKSK